jgi:hypothetical protein
MPNLEQLKVQLEDYLKQAEVTPGILGVLLKSIQESNLSLYDIIIAIEPTDEYFHKLMNSNGMEALLASLLSAPRLLNKNALGLFQLAQMTSDPEHKYYDPEYKYYKLLLDSFPETVLVNVVNKLNLLHNELIQENFELLLYILLSLSKSNENNLSAVVTHQNEGNNILHLAVKKGHPAIADTILRLISKPELGDVVYRTDSEGNTLFHLLSDINYDSSKIINRLNNKQQLNLLPRNPAARVSQQGLYKKSNLNLNELNEVKDLQETRNNPHTRSGK